MDFANLESGYYVIQEKIARTKHIVKVQDNAAQFFGTKREPLNEMAEHYSVISKLDIQLESRSTAVRSA